MTLKEFFAITTVSKDIRIQISTLDDDDEIILSRDIELNTITHLNDNDKLNKQLCGIFFKLDRENKVVLEICLENYYDN